MLWDVTFRTAVAQAEIEDRPMQAQLLAAGLRLPGGSEVVVATTRPELLPACVALVAHPDDERYAPCSARRRRTPLFGVSVPMLAHHLADPAKGTGIAMVCTFGDTTDVTWWRDLALPTRPVLGPDGRLLAEPPGLDHEPDGTAAYAETGRADHKGGQDRDRRPARAAGALRGEAEPVTHPVKFYEKGDAPLEIITARQWYVATGAAIARLRQRLIDRGRELTWHPPHMRARYEDWVERPDRRLADQPPAVLRRADPGLVPGGRRRHAGLRRRRSCRPTTRCRSTRSPNRRPATSQASATSPAGSPPTRT